MQTFQTALDSALCMQSGIYQKMAEHGWYTTQQAQPQSIQQVRQKYSAIG